MAGLSYYSNLLVSDYRSMGRVWNLFAELGYRSNLAIIQESRDGSPDRYQFFESLIRNASMGAQYEREDGENFNLMAYDYAVRKREAIRRFKELEKCIYLVNEIDKGGSEDVSDGYGEYSENRLIRDNDDFTKVEENIDYMLAWGAFPEILKVTTNMGYDIIYLLSLSLSGNKLSIQTLTQLSEEYPPVKEFLEGVLVNDKLPDVIKRLLEYGGT